MKKYAAPCSLQGRYPEALADLNEAVQLNPNDAESLYKRGRIYAYGNRGRLYLAQGQIEQALADLDEALRRNPRHVDARFGLLDTAILGGFPERDLLR